MLLCLFILHREQINNKAHNGDMEGNRVSIDDRPIIKAVLYVMS